MSNATSLFGKYLIERGISLADYAEMSREQKVRLQDEYDSESWRKRSEAATAELAAIPRDFFIWLQATKDVDRATFETMTARQQAAFADEHSYALSQAAQKQKAAAEKPVVLPKAIQDMPEGTSKNRAVLDYVNRKSMEDAGYIPRQECAD